jgi:ureidoacrylate peracid hydrolase
MSSDLSRRTTLQERLSPRRAAFMFVDLQNDFGSPKGKMAEFGFDVSMVQDSAAQTRRLLEAARSAGFLVVHTAVVNELGQNAASWTAFWGPPTVTLPGSWGAAHVEGFTPKPGEPVIVKYAYGAFVGTNLDTMLRSRGIDTIVFAGADINITPSRWATTSWPRQTACPASRSAAASTRSS